MRIVTGVIILGLIGCASDDPAPPTTVILADDVPGADTAVADTAVADTGPEPDVATLPSGADPITVSEAVVLPGFTRTAASLAVADAGLVVCAGNTVQIGPDSVGLDAACVAVAADGSSVVVATVDERWHRVTDGAVTASVDGPIPLGLIIADGTVYGSAGTVGLVAGPATLETAPAALWGAGDARAVLPLADGRLLVADGLFGAVLLDPVAGTSAPLIEIPKPFALATAVVALDTDAAEPSLAVIAFAGHGLLVVDTSLGEVVASVEDQALIMGLALGPNGLIMAGDWTHARLFDFGTPTEPKLIASEERLDRSISTVWHDGAFYSAGLSERVALTPDVAVVVPELHLERRKMPIELNPEFGLAGAGILVFNQGRADLLVSGITLADSRFVLSPLLDSGIPGVDLVISPGAVEFLELTITGEGSFQSELAFSTNDPDNSDVVITLDVNPQLVVVDSAATDFVVPTVSGHLIRLEEFLGRVPHFKFFNAY